MADLKISFSSVSIPSGASADITIKEDTSGDGNADNIATASMSDGTTSYTLSGFDGSSGNDVWWELSLSNTDLEAGQIVTGSTTVETTSLIIDASVAEVPLSSPDPSVSASGTITVSASTATIPLVAPQPDLGGTADWIVDDIHLQRVVNVEFSAQELTLGIRASGGTRRRLRRFRDVAEEVGVVTDDDGQFKTVDRSSSGNQWTVKPPTRERPPHVVLDMLVDGYSERELAQNSDASRIDLTLVKPESRDATGSEPSETRASDEWLFKFANADVATKRVTRGREALADTSTDVEAITLVLTDLQTLGLATSASYPGATDVVEVPDGANLSTDDSDSGRQTVTVTAPSEKEEVLGDGTYVVDDWSAERIDSDSYEVSLRLRPT